LRLTPRAQSPAAFAEQYIVESIWDGKFPPGSILPAERELSELIGVTRTTLREVLQRLARDGWLTIQHGKPTRVNDYWQTAGLNILDTVARLDDSGPIKLVNNLLEARTNVSTIYIKAAYKNDIDTVLKMLASRELEDTAEAYAEFDWSLQHQFTLASGNLVYTLILNGFRKVYLQVAKYFFSNDKARRVTDKFFDSLADIANRRATEELIPLIRQYGRETGEIWATMSDKMPEILES
jgi:GntR family transcriptional regulator, negative regulator for fad regulon and positive regulator of fabA